MSTFSRTSIRSTECACTFLAWMSGEAAASGAGVVACSEDASKKKTALRQAPCGFLSFTLPSSPVPCSPLGGSSCPSYRLQPESRRANEVRTSRCSDGIKPRIKVAPVAFQWGFRPLWERGDTPLLIEPVY